MTMTTKARTTGRDEHLLVRDRSAPSLKSLFVPAPDEQELVPTGLIHSQAREKKLQ
jgi:hypothetical protein